MKPKSKVKVRKCQLMRSRVKVKYFQKMLRARKGSGVVLMRKIGKKTVCRPQIPS